VNAHAIATRFERRNLGFGILICTVHVRPFFGRERRDIRDGGSKCGTLIKGFKVEGYQVIQVNLRSCSACLKFGRLQEGRRLNVQR
jgi:hypothetical protein